MQQQPETTQPGPDKAPEQAGIGSGTPPARVPGAPAGTDLEPEQEPLRDTPGVTGPGVAQP